MDVSNNKASHYTQKTTFFLNVHLFIFHYKVSELYPHVNVTLSNQEGALQFTFEQIAKFHSLVPLLHNPDDLELILRFLQRYIVIQCDCKSFFMLTILTTTCSTKIKQNSISYKSHDWPSTRQRSPKKDSYLV